MKNRINKLSETQSAIIAAPPGQKVSTYGCITVRAVANSYVQAEAGATIIAEACSFIEARHGSRIMAKDGCVIFSYGGAKIDREANARVLIIDKKNLDDAPLQLAIAKRDGKFTSRKVILALEGVHVKTEDNCFILAFPGAIVETGDNCRVVTFDSCVIKTGNNCFINAGKRCRVYRGHKCRVQVGPGSFVTMEKVSSINELL